jgi:hypothetical protein
VKFIGITRFNLVTSRTLGDFNSTRHLTLDQAKELVFDPSRLDAKMSTFQDFCLPTYRALASGSDNSHGLVLINHDLPQPYRTRLAQWCETVPRLQLVQFQDDDALAARIDPILADLADGERVFSYRYDDDDVLSTQFLSVVERMCADAPDGTAVSMNKGLLMARLGDDSFGVYEQDYPLNAYGLGLLSSAEAPKNVFSLGSHDKVSVPVIHERETSAWIAFRHGLNDSQVNGTELNRLKRLAEHARPGEQTVETLTESFPHISLDALRRLPELSIRHNLDTIARRALRRNRAVETALVSERKKIKRLRQELADAKAALTATQATLTKTRASLSKHHSSLQHHKTVLARTRRELKSTDAALTDLRTSRSYRVGRVIAETRSLRSWLTLATRLYSAYGPGGVTSTTPQPAAGSRPTPPAVPAANTQLTPRPGQSTEHSDAVR